MPNLRLCVCLAFFAGLVACIKSDSPGTAQVFAGPADLALHEDIKPKSRVVGRVHHGDKLAVLQQRRRLYKLRAKSGLEGWTDERNLMSAAQMQTLAQLEEKARRLPTQGVATTFETLNVHTEPQRYSPSFFQIKEGEKFDVIAHQTGSRAEPKRRTLIPPQPRAAPRDRKASRSGSRRVPLPPSPTPPKPPDDWLELSQEREPPPDTKTEEQDDAKEVAPTDDWTLVRTTHGTAGWVLTGRIYLAIPDEVAQYAEGRRITTYFSLGKIHDSELNADKDIWLWTTVHAGVHPYDFDNFRVFTWNPRRHRYETSYIQRSVEGYLPVLVEKTGGQTMFSVCLANEDDSRSRRRFVMVDRQVKSADVQPCSDAPAPPPETAPSLPQGAKPASSLSQRLENKLGDAKKRLLGH